MPNEFVVRNRKCFARGDAISGSQETRVTLSDATQASFWSLFANTVPRCGLTCLRRLEHLDSSRIKIGPQVCIFDGRQRDCFPVVQTCQGSVDTIFRRHDRGRIEVVDANTGDIPNLRIRTRRQDELHAYLRVLQLITETDGEQHHVDCVEAPAALAALYEVLIGSAKKERTEPMLTSVP
jgi:hypothetical protein